jgi:predicted phosphoribosyltransferase
MVEGEDSFRNNREDAGRRLAERLAEYRDEDFDRVPDKEVVVLLGRARRDQDERGATGLEGRR